MSGSRAGGCQCGALRYRIEGEPRTLAVCHCSECQRQSGSAFGMSLVVPRGAFRLERGEPKVFTRTSDAGRAVDCAFCADCGTRIYHAPRAMTETVNVKPGTLDDTTWLVPRLHAWTRRRQPWVAIPQGMRCFEENPF